MILWTMCLSGSNRSTLAGESAMPYSAVGNCEIEKHNSGLLCRKPILDILRQQGDLIYGRLPTSKVCLPDGVMDR